MLRGSGPPRQRGSPGPTLSEPEARMPRTRRAIPFKQRRGRHKQPRVSPALKKHAITYDDILRIRQDLARGR
jgi:hypothetical protein